MSSSPRAFTINVSQEDCEWINQRLRTARIIPDVLHKPGKEWSHGTPTHVVRELVDYWKEEYDWRRVEKRLNETFKMFLMELEEGDETLDVHFVHHKSTRVDAIPLLFIHGWPGNFLEVESLLELVEPKDLLTQAYHIVSPSIPGFTFSSPPKKAGFLTTPNIASLFNTLMHKLGYQHYIGQGGDWGSFILRAMALRFPSSCLGIHINYMLSLPPSPVQHPITFLWIVSKWFTPYEAERMKRMEWWMKEELNYALIQGSKPQSLSYGLLDSPVGMLAWIREKLESLSDPSYHWSKENVITWTMLYVLSGNAGHARIYKDSLPTQFHDSMVKLPKDVLVGVSCFPWDVAYVPRWWAEVTFSESIIFWKEHDRGGHFASVECGDLLRDDLQTFVAGIAPETRELLFKSGK